MQEPTSTSLSIRTLLYYFGAFALPAAIFLFSFLLARGELARNQPELFIGITYDLILLAPLVYLWAVRKTRIPALTAVPVMVLGIVVAHLIIPEGEQTHLNFLVTYLVPVVELGVVVTIGVMVVKGIHIYREEKAQHPDVYQLLRVTSIRALKNELLGKILSSELAMLYYALVAWRKRPLPDGQFSYFQRSASLPILWGMMLMIGVETALVHILLARWSPLAAWIATGLSAYSGLMILGHIHAIRRRNHVLTPQALILKSGLLGTGTVPLEAIAKWEISPLVPESESNPVRFTPLGELESHNLVLHLHQEVELEGMYGLRKPARCLLIYVDQPEALTTQLTQLGVNNPQIVEE